MPLCGKSTPHGKAGGFVNDAYGNAVKKRPRLVPAMVLNAERALLHVRVETGTRPRRMRRRWESRFQAGAEKSKIYSFLGGNAFGKGVFQGMHFRDRVRFLYEPFRGIASGKDKMRFSLSACRHDPFYVFS